MLFNSGRVDLVLNLVSTMGNKFHAGLTDSAVIIVITLLILITFFLLTSLLLLSRLIIVIN